ncbi:hypothetical protein [Treponema sp. C6A8]|uniref:hypothetical protein n=1 Tax=Treponema sp. C6A8 TaxID=1410609 RepID=UPI0004851C29|nr:hypothetical protein [Treponema sp. C6A8]
MNNSITISTERASRFIIKEINLLSFIIIFLLSFVPIFAKNNAPEISPEALEYINRPVKKFYSFNQIYETNSNLIFFDFTGFDVGWCIVKNNTDKTIDVSCLQGIDENSTIVPSNSYNYFYCYHSDLKPNYEHILLDNYELTLGEHVINDYDYSLRWDGIEKLALEISNGNVTKYELSTANVTNWRSNMSRAIVITILDFEEKNVDLLPKEIDIVDTHFLNDANSQFIKNKFHKEKKYFTEAYFFYNEDEAAIRVRNKWYKTTDLIKEQCNDFISKNPDIKTITAETENMYTFIFEKNTDSFFVLTAIEGYCWDSLPEVLFSEKHYKKINDSIKGKVLTLSIRDANFINNNPYGFKKNYYYNDEHKWGYVYQWIDEKTCLYDFAPDTAYTAGQGLALVVFDNSIQQFPFNKKILYHYEGAYTYDTSDGGTNTVPKFSVIFSTDDYNIPSDIPSNTEFEMKELSYKDYCFKNNNPYGFLKNCKYTENKTIKGKVLQWLEDGCLYDFAGPITELNYFCISYLVLAEEDRNKFFDSDISHYFIYSGVFCYENVNNQMLTVPMFKVVFDEN